MFEPIHELDSNKPIIKVIGVGGAGCNAVDHIVDAISESGDHCVELYAVNTDAQALRNSKVRYTVQIGANLTKGLG